MHYRAGMNASTQLESATDGAAITASEAAKLLGVSERTIWKLNSTAAMPRPVRLLRCVRWRRDELLAWLAAGCPNRETWERSRKEVPV